MAIRRLLTDTANRMLQNRTASHTAASSQGNTSGGRRYQTSRPTQTYTAVSGTIQRMVSAMTSDGSNNNKPTGVSKAGAVATRKHNYTRSEMNRNTAAGQTVYNAIEGKGQEYAGSILKSATTAADNFTKGKATLGKFLDNTPAGDINRAIKGASTVTSIARYVGRNTEPVKGFENIIQKSDEVSGKMIHKGEESLQELKQKATLNGKHVKAKEFGLDAAWTAADVAMDVALTRIAPGTAETTAAKYTSKAGQIVGGVVKGGGNRAVGDILMGMRSYGAARQQALDAGATEEQADKNGLVNATTEILSERMFSANKILAGTYGQGFADSVVDALQRKLVAKVSNKSRKEVVDFITRNASGMLEEGLEELVAEGIEPRAANLIYGNALKDEGIQDTNALIDDLADKYNLNAGSVNSLKDKINNGASDDSVAMTLNDLMAYGVTQDEAKEILAGYMDANSKISTADYGRSFALGAVVGGVFGGASNVMAAAQARDVEAEAAQYFGDGGIKEAIQKAMASDDAGVAAQAAALAEELQTTGSISNVAAKEILDAAIAQDNIDLSREHSSRTAAVQEIQKQGYAYPYAFNQDGSIEHTETSEGVMNDMAGRTAQIINSTPQIRGSLSEAQVQDVANAVGSYAAGTLTASEAKVFAYENTEARAAFQEATGLELPVVEHKGKVNVAETNAATKDFLFSGAATNAVEVARQETDVLRNDLKGRVESQMLNNLGAKGQEAFALSQAAMPEATPMDIERNATAFKTYYDAGRNGRMVFSAVDGMIGNQFSEIDEATRRAAFEAGQEDAKRAVREASRRGEAISRIAEENRSQLNSRAERGILTVELNSADGTAIKKSQLELFRLLAQSLNVNIHIVSGDDARVKGGNGANYIGTGDIYLNATMLGENRADRVLEYIFGHEITHHIKIYAPEEYTRLENLVRQRWNERDLKGQTSDGLTTMAEAIRSKQELYRQQVDQELTEEQALEEIIADATYEMFNDEEFMTRVAEQEPALGKAILSAIQKMIANIRDVLARGMGFTPKQNADLLSQLGILKEAEDLWLNGLATARLNAAAVGGKFGKTSPYDGRNLADNFELYNYEFLTAMPDMNVVMLPDVADVVDDTGRINRKEIGNTVVSETQEVVNKYTHRTIKINKRSVRHGIDGNFGRMMTNARGGRAMAQLLTEGIPINALKNDAENVNVVGTYAIATYAQDSNGREFVFISTIEQQSGELTSLEVYDVAHSTSGRIKKGSSVDTKSQGVTPSTASTISIEDLIKVVNETHRSVLSKDVLDKLREERPANGYYTNRVKFSAPEDGKPTEGTVENLWNGIDVGVRFSYGEQGTWYASAIKPNQGTDKPTQASVAKNRMLSGREMLRSTMEQYGNKNTWEDQFNSVSNFMDAMNQFFIDAGAKYRFIGLQDVENATVKVRRKGNKITGITMSAMIKNGEYPINFDFTTICKKRQAFNDVIEKLTKNSKVGDDISLTAAELMDINEALRKEGVETACLGCFVEARRYNMQNYTEKVVNLWNKCVDEFAEANGITDVPDFNFAGGEEATEQDFQDAADTFLSYGKTKGNKQSPEARFRIIIAQSDGKYVKHLRASDLVTANGVAGIKAMSTTKNDFYGMLKSAYGTAAPKETVKFVPYNSEIANLPKTKSKMPMDKYLKEIGGIRMQSFSDFLVANTFDYMQMVADASARGFTAHSYTKEIAFAKIFGKTGVKINMSVMFDVLTPAEWGEALGISDDAESLKSIAKTYAGMQFFRSESDIPEELKDSAVKTNIKGVDGWLTYLVSDQDRADRGYEELYKKAYDLTGNEETAKEIAGDGRKWMQSINFREAKELQRAEGYADNVGIIAVGLSDENIRHMMADDNIPYIIPYHASGLPGVVKARTNLDNATDYTETQNTRIFVKATAPDGTIYNTFDEFKALKGDKTWQEFYKMVNEGGYLIESKGDDTLHGTGEFDVYGPLEDGKTPQQVADLYMEDCAAKGLIPVFSQFADHDGYYKVLFDYSVTNLTNGNTAPQQTVRNNYPGVDVDAGETDYSELQQIIDDEMAKQNEINERRDAVVERVANDFAARFSVSEETESEYRKAYESGDAETAQRLVDEAAEKAGYSIKGYHGTNDFGFTEFKPNKSPDGTTLFLASDPALSRSYVAYRGMMKTPEVKQIGKRKPAVKRGTKYTEAQLRDMAMQYKNLGSVTLYGEVKVNEEKQNVTIGGDKISGYSLAKAIESESKRGIYDTFIRMDNPLVVEGNGSNWNRLEVPTALKDEFDAWAADKTISEENGYTFQYHDGLTNTRTYGSFAKASGYDGVIFKDIHDVGGVSSVRMKSVEESLFDTYIVFNSNQIKSADPFTFDEAGELVPLSERFNPNSNDIRYSITNVDSDGNELSQGQREFFAESKVADEQGNLVPMYHGTSAEFTVFDKGHIGATGRFEGAGFNFTSFEGRAMSYDTSGQGNVFKTYLNVTSPLSDKEKTLSRAAINDIVRNIAQQEDIEGYDSIIFAIAAPMGRNINEDYFHGLTETVDYLWRNCDTDADVYAQISTLGTNDEVVIDAFEKKGFDGVIWHDDYDGSIKTVIAFEPEQIKLTDNLEPSTNPDVRFSIKASEDYIVANEDEFDDLPIHDARIRASHNRREATTKLIAQKADAMRKDSRVTKGKVVNTKSIEPAVRELIMMTMENSESSKKYKQSLVKQTVQAVKMIYAKIQEDDFNAAADIAYDVSLEIAENITLVNDDLWEQYRELRNHIKKTPMALAEEDMADIPDFEAWRKANFGRFKIRRNGLPVDIMYQELNELWPEVFPEDITHPADQAMQIADVLEEMQPYEYAYTSEEADAIAQDLSMNLCTIAYTGTSWKSYADKAREKLLRETAALKQRHKEAQNDIRTAERIAAGREKAELKSQYDEKLQAQKAKYESRIEAEKQKTEAVKQKEKEKRMAQQWLATEREAVLEGLAQKRIQREQRKLVAYKAKVKERNAEKKSFKERAKHFGRIYDNYMWISDRLIKPTDTKHIPEEFRAELARFLMLFDLQSNRSKGLEEKYGKIAKKTMRLHALRAALDNISAEDFGEGGGIFVKDEFLDYELGQIALRLDGRPIDELDGKDMEVIDILLRAVRHQIAAENKAFTEGIKQRIEELARASFEAFTQKVDLYGIKGELTGIRKYVDAIINESAVTPRDFFELIGGGLNTVYLRGLRKGLDKHILNIDWVRGEFADIFTQYNNKKKPGSEIEAWRNSTNLETFTVDGITFNMTPAQIMSLYCLIQREQASGHVFGSGFVVTSIDPTVSTDNFFKAEFQKAKTAVGIKLQNNNMKVEIGYDQAQEIVSKLTDEQVEMAKRLQKILEGKCADWGNETSMKLFGYKKFKEANYFPITSAKEFLSSDYGKHSSVEKIKNFGFTKPTKERANNAIVIDDIFDVVADHINKMSLYNAFACPISDMTRLMNAVAYNEDGTQDTTIKQELKQAYGQNALRYVETFLADVQTQQQTKKDGMTALIKKSLANQKKALIGFSLSVLVQQPTAIVRAFDLISPRYFLHGSNIKQNIREMKEHCPIALWKSWGFSQVDMANGIDDIMMNKEWSKVDVITMMPYGLADEITWGFIWAAVKQEVSAKNPSVEYGSDEYWELCNDRASEVYDKTQVVDSPLHRAESMRSDQIMVQMMMSFMAEPLRTLNMLRTDIVKARTLKKTGNDAQARQMLTRTVTVFVANAAACSAAKALVDAMRDQFSGDDDKDYENFLEAWLKSFIGNFANNANPITMTPFFKDIWQLGEGWGTSNTALEGYEKLMTGAKDLLECMVGKEDNWGKAVWKFTQGIGYVTGLPIKNVARDMNVMLNMFGIQINPLAAEKGGDSDLMNLLGISSDKKAEPYASPYDRSIDTANPSNGKFLKLFNIKEGGDFDNFLDKHGYTLSDEEYAAKLQTERAKLVEDKVKDFSGDERTKHVNSIVTDNTLYKDQTYSDGAKINLGNAIEHGDYATVREMREVIEACGGDLEAFDKNVESKTGSAYRKLIGDDSFEAFDKRDEMQKYLMSRGWTQEKISSQIVAGTNGGNKCEMATQFQVAYSEGNETEIINTLTSLIEAGLTEEDYNQLVYKASSAAKAYAYSSGSFGSPVENNACEVVEHIGTYGNDYTTFATESGAGITAIDGGKVTFVGVYKTKGAQVVIDHGNGFKTYYTGMTAFNVPKGRVLHQGDIIAYSGGQFTIKVTYNGEIVDIEQLMEMQGRAE